MTEKPDQFHSMLAEEVTMVYGPLEELSTGFEVDFFDPSLGTLTLKRNNVDVEYRFFEGETYRRERVSKLSPSNKQAASYLIECTRGGNDLLISMDHTVLKTGDFRLSLYGSIKSDNQTDTNDVAQIAYREYKPYSIRFPVQQLLEEPVATSNNAFEVYNRLNNILHLPNPGLFIPNLSQYAEGEVVSSKGGHFCKRTYSDRLWLMRYSNDNSYVVADLPSKISKNDLEDLMQSQEWFRMPLIRTAGLYRQP